MFNRMRNGFLEVLAPVALCVLAIFNGCACGAARETVLQTHSRQCLTGVTLMTPDPYRAVADQLAKPSGPLLVVITYGNGCSASGPGNGLRDLADAIRRLHPNQQVITRGWDDDDGIIATVERHRGPVALIGHSFGGCRSIELAAQVRRRVDWLILLDPVPCDDWATRHAGRYFRVPPCVRNAICFYRPAAIWPISYPLLTPPSPDDNRMRRIGHNAFCRSSEVQQCILDVCQRAVIH